MLELHALHHLARCPYHPQAGPLIASPSDTRYRSLTLRCEECSREYDVENGVYRLMPDELRSSSTVSDAADSAISQQKREMQQRDERAARGAGFVRVPQTSPLFWMNIQFDAVTRHATVAPDGVCIDYGTGVGRYIPWLLERARWIIATDFSFASLRSLHDRLTPEERARCLLIHCDLSKLPLADAVASTGLCVEVLQHLPSRKLRAAAVAELARTLRPDGELFLATKAHPAARRIEESLRLAIWSLGRLAGKAEPRPDAGQETVEGPIYTYWHTYAEMKNLVQPQLRIRAARGIISYESFPIRFLNPKIRIALDKWLEANTLGRHFGRDHLLHLVRGRNANRFRPPTPTHRRPVRTAELVS